MRDVSIGAVALGAGVGAILALVERGDLTRGASPEPNDARPHEAIPATPDDGEPGERLALVTPSASLLPIVAPAVAIAPCDPPVATSAAAAAGVSCAGEPARARGAPLLPGDQGDAAPAGSRVPDEPFVAIGRWPEGLPAALGMGAVEAQLAVRLVNLAADGASPLEVLDLLARASGLAFEVLPEAMPSLRNAEVMLVLRGMTLGNALHLLLASGDDVTYWVDGDRIVVGSWESAPVRSEQFYRETYSVPLERDGLPEWEEAYRDFLARRRVSVDLDASLEDVVSLIRDIAELNVVVSSQVDAAANVRFRREDITLDDLLQEVLPPLGLGYVLRDEALFIVPSGEAARDAEVGAIIASEREDGARILALAVPAGLRHGTVSDAARLIERATGVRVELDVCAAAARATLDLPAGRSLEEVCDRVRLAAGIDWGLLRSEDSGDYLLSWFGSRDVVEDLIATAARATRPERIPDPALRARASGWLEEVGVHLRTSEAARAQGGAQEGPSAVARACERAEGTLRLALVRAAGAWLLAGAFDPADGPSPAERIALAHRLASALDETPGEEIWPRALARAGDGGGGETPASWLDPGPVAEETCAFLLRPEEAPGEQPPPHPALAAFGGTP